MMIHMKKKTEWWIGDNDTSDKLRVMEHGLFYQKHRPFYVGLIYDKSAPGGLKIYHDLESCLSQLKADAC